MKKIEALEQLCKMQGEIAGCLGIETVCVCHDGAHKSALDSVPDKVIEEMWRRLTDSRWVEEERCASTRATTLPRCSPT